MSFVEQIFNQFQQRFFQSLVKDRLVYNTCWEDPRIDRKLLQLREDSRVVMLTSAGCNALDYLLDEPAEIYCVDTNPAQNALAAIKKTLITHGDYALLWKMLGTGRCKTVHSTYHRNLRPTMKPPTAQFWDRHINYFLPSASPNSFYYRGTAGTMAYFVHQHIQHKGIFGTIQNLLNSTSRKKQCYYFDKVEPHLWNVFSRWLVKRDATMAMLGVPRGQREIIDNETDGGIASFIYQSIRDVFTTRCITDNYFWRVYLTGSYTKTCCPNYLKENNFEQLRKRIDRLHLQTTSLVKFLDKNPGPYSHFVLLDHQDWLANHAPAMLEREWRLILKNARHNAKILFRSAGASRSFLPEFAKEQLLFDDSQTQQLHHQDRVGTYGSTHLAIVE